MNDELDQWAKFMPDSLKAELEELRERLAAIEAKLESGTGSTNVVIHG